MFKGDQWEERCIVSAFNQSIVLMLWGRNVAFLLQAAILEFSSTYFSLPPPYSSPFPFLFLPSLSSAYPLRFSSSPYPPISLPLSAFSNHPFPSSLSHYPPIWLSPFFSLPSPISPFLPSLIPFPPPLIFFLPQLTPSPPLLILFFPQLIRLPPPSIHSSSVCHPCIHPFPSLTHPLSSFAHPLSSSPIQFSSYIRKFRREQLQSHTWLPAFSYMTKYFRISSYIRKPFFIYNFYILNFLRYEENFIFFFISHSSSIVLLLSLPSSTDPLPSSQSSCSILHALILFPPSLPSLFFSLSSPSVLLAVFFSLGWLFMLSHLLFPYFLSLFPSLSQFLSFLCPFYIVILPYLSLFLFLSHFLSFSCVFCYVFPPFIHYLSLYHTSLLLFIALLFYLAFSSSISSLCHMSLHL